LTSRARPNIVLVVLDTARADAFEPYGAPVGFSPTIGELAARGQSATAFATASWTVPSHVSLLSGLLPYAAGLTNKYGFDRANFHAVLKMLRDRLLPEVLRTYGYTTAAVSANTWVSAASGFDTGFDTFRQVVGQRYTDQRGGTRRDRLASAWQAFRADIDDGAGDVERLLHEWLGTRGRAPFFWFVNLVECHSPYQPPRPYNPLPPWGRMKAAEEAREHLTFAALTIASLRRSGAPPEALDRMRKLYAGAIRLMDDWLGRLVESLERAGVIDETIIVVTSDHGENFGEGGLMGHQFSLDDRLIRVPLVALGPNIALPGRNVSLAEIPRLLADAAGLPAHPWKGDDAPTGGVVVSELEPPAGPEHPVSLGVAKEYDLDAATFERMTSGLTCATDGHHKLFRQAGREFVVDLSRDPLELSPVPVGAEQEAALADLLPHMRAALDRAAATTGYTPYPSDEDVDPADLAHMEAQLKLLGYL
jgi:arylsulfatase A-like enzyme